MILEGLVLGGSALLTWLGVRQADARNKANGPIQLQQGALYQVNFAVPQKGAAVTLGQTGWQPVGAAPQSKDGVNYTMQARWTGPSGTFYGVNPLVAGPNKVALVTLLQAAPPLATAAPAKTSGYSIFGAHFGTALRGQPKGTPNGNPHRRKFW